ncbi:MAG: M15 family metallopeptidase [Clostridia bacterium]|nr:M15 family metallopeptidase [Clostridia bacterium]
MKKIIALLLLFAMALTLVSCDSDGDGADGQDAPSFSSVEPSGDSEDSLAFEKDVAVTESKNVHLKFYTDQGTNLVRIRVSDGNDVYEIDVKAVAKDVLGLNGGALSDDAEFRFFTKDINFDGFGDFAVQAFKKNGDTVPYLCWFWDNGEAEYVFGAELESPMFDPVNSRIYCNVSENGEDYISVYSAADGKILFSESVSVSQNVSFMSDLSGYEEFMAPAERDSYLVLVNYENTLDENYVPGDLTDVTNTRLDGRATQQMRYTAAMALEALYIEMNAAGYNDVSVTSAYRPYDYQSQLFNGYIDQEMAENGYTYEEAYNIVKTYSAIPGTSEHQTGLCCDMHNLGAADQAFANQPAYEWLKDNAWKFGFILRFPENKEDITQITFEPWHYRFVGRYHAARIHAMGLCLEEYLALINN